MDKKEFEDIIRPLVMLPNDQRKLLKEVLMKNFNKWAENKQLTLTEVVSTCCEKAQKHNDLLKDEFKDNYCGWCDRKLV